MLSRTNWAYAVHPYPKYSCICGKKSPSTDKYFFVFTVNLPVESF